MRTLRDHPVLTFFALAYGISWGAAGVLEFIARDLGLNHFGDLMRMAESTFDFSGVRGRLPVPVLVVWILTRIVDFGPSIAGLVAAMLVGGRSGVRELAAALGRWRIAPRWYAIALLGPPTVILAAALLFGLLNGFAVLAPNVVLPASIGTLVFWLGVRTFLGGGLGEEVGWRGFALPRLLEHGGPLAASWRIGMAWTFWHLPGHLVSASPAGSLFGQLLVTVPGSFIFTWLYLRSGKSLPAVVLLHGAMNGYLWFFEKSLFPGLDDRGSWLLGFLAILIGLAIWAAADLARTAGEPKE